MKTNVSPVAARRSRCGSRVKSLAYTPRSVTPRQRVAEFPGEFLDVSERFVCTTCREEISSKCQVIRLHVHLKKHMTGKERLQVKESRDVDIPKCFQQYSCRENVVGMTLPTDCQVHRIKVDTAFLKAGIPLNKIDCF